MEPPVAETQCEVELPAVYVLEWHLVHAAIAGAFNTDDDGDVGITLWIHHTTVGIDEDCFRGMRRRVSRFSRSTSQSASLRTHPPQQQQSWVHS